jgi:hypothetical protein
MRQLVGALATVFLAFVSCGAGFGRTLREPALMPIEQQVPDVATNPVIIVTIDGVMWQDAFGSQSHELMPNTWRAVEARGSALGAPGHGEAFSASGPNFVSLPGYTELFEGRTRTGCTTNFCDGATAPTLADEIKAQHVDEPASVAVIASWDRIANAATISSFDLVIDAGSAQAQAGEAVLLENPHTQWAYHAGYHVNSWPGHGDYRADRDTASLALAYLQVNRPAFLFIGLGDTDEYAHRGDRPRYEASLRYADQVIGSVFEELRQMGRRGEMTTVIITADHGRANNFRDHGGDHPESAQSWLFVVGPRISRGMYVSAPVPRHLADIAPTVRFLVGLPVNLLSDGTVMRELL